MFLCRSDTLKSDQPISQRRRRRRRAACWRKLGLQLEARTPLSRSSLGANLTPSSRPTSAISSFGSELSLKSFPRFRWPHARWLELGAHIHSIESQTRPPPRHRLSAENSINLAKTGALSLEQTSLGAKQAAANPYGDGGASASSEALELAAPMFALASAKINFHQRGGLVWPSVAGRDTQSIFARPRVMRLAQGAGQHQQVCGR